MMSERIEIRGIRHLAGAYDNYTLAKFKEQYQWQWPYRAMRPVEREKALEADFKQLTPKSAKKKVDEAEKID